MTHTRTFRGRSIEQAMRTAKRTLGEEALLISAAKVIAPDPEGVLYEVSVQAAHTPGRAFRSKVDYSFLRRDLAEIAHTLSEGDDPAHRVAAIDLSPAVDSDLRPDLERWTEEEVSMRVNNAKAIALLGPAAVGKTTLCAKLLLTYGLKRGRSSCWITVGSEQVGCGRGARFLAGLLGVPCVSVEMGTSIPWPGAGSVSSFGIFDLPSLHTPSDRPPDELRTMLSSIQGLLTLFVVDARFGEASLDRAYERVRPFKPTALVANMADEVASLCAIERFAARNRLPIALLGTGHSIPEDLVAASGFTLSRGLAFPPSAVPAA